jgi:hypothetical protein
MGWEKLGEELHVGEVLGDYEPVVADEGFACGADARFAVGGEGQLGGTGVAAVEGPFCFAVADYEDTGVGHCGILELEGLERSNRKRGGNCDTIGQLERRGEKKEVDAKTDVKTIAEFVRGEMLMTTCASLEG